MLSTLVYDCETWTLLEEYKKRLNAFESESHRIILTSHIDNEKKCIYL